MQDRLARAFEHTWQDVWYAAVQDYRQGATAFADVFAFDVRINGLGVGSTTTQFVTQAVTGNFFAGLGLTPVAGRSFEPGEGERANAEPLIVLGVICDSRFKIHRFLNRES
jgi:hypothetical protein